MKLDLDASRPADRQDTGRGTRDRHPPAAQAGTGDDTSTASRAADAVNSVLSVDSDVHAGAMGDPVVQYAYEKAVAEAQGAEAQGGRRLGGRNSLWELQVMAVTR